MDVNDILKSLGDQFAISAAAKNVYGDPVSVGERTVIPVASVRFGFGGGGGGRKGLKKEDDGGDDAGHAGEGGGGGGGLIARPAGALEISEEGTRFICFPEYGKICAAITLGFLIGLVVARRR